VENITRTRLLTKPAIINALMLEYDVSLKMASECHKSRLSGRGSLLPFSADKTGRMFVDFTSEEEVKMGLVLLQMLSFGQNNDVEGIFYRQHKDIFIVNSCKNNFAMEDCVEEYKTILTSELMYDDVFFKSALRWQKQMNVTGAAVKGKTTGVRLSSHERLAAANKDAEPKF
jgi:hypothetical protein